MKTTLIAPCGMNCALCVGHQREKDKCPGCFAMDKDKSKYCRKCIIKNCLELKKNKAKYCFSCQKFPCARLKNLDKRYKTKYNMSMLVNQEYIQKYGIRKFVKSQEKKYTCKKCGELLCVHRDKCFYCNK